MTACDLEHTTRANEGNLRTLKTNQGNINRHITLLSCTSLQSHRDFNVLNIVLGHGEYSVAITHHTGGIVTAAPVHNLEALIDRTAVFNGNSTAALDVAPGVQITALIDGNGAARLHLNKAGIANRTAEAARRCLRSRQAQRTINGNMRTFSHRHRAICFDCAVAGVYSNRRSGAQGIGIVVGDQQGDAAGDGVITSRQNTAVCQNNGLVAAGVGYSQSFVQILIQKVAIDQEACVLGEDSLDSHIGCRLQLIGSCAGQQSTGLRIDPTQEGSTILGSGLQLNTRHRNVHLSTGIGHITSHSDATQLVVVLEGHLGRFLCCHTGKVLHHQLVLVGVLCSGDRNHKVRTCFQNLAKAAGSAAVHSAVNLQLIDGAGSPVKGNGCLTAAFVVDGNRSSLGAGTDAKNATATLCGNGNSAIGHGVIAGTRDANGNTGNRLVGTAGGKQCDLTELVHSFEQLSASLHIRVGLDVLHICLSGRLKCLGERIQLVHSFKELIIALFIHGLENLILGHISVDSIGLHDGIDLCRYRNSKCRCLSCLFRCRLGRRGIRDTVLFLMVMVICRKYLYRYCGENHDHSQEKGQCAFSILCYHNNSSYKNFIVYFHHN